MTLVRWTAAGVALGFAVALGYVLLRSGELYETGDAVLALGTIGMLIGGLCGFTACMLREPPLDDDDR